ncbi:MAG: response regulator transcription factor [Firmicutes bacterium]|nr:response regulator transcription factor [Bacillota bacterium]
MKVTKNMQKSKNILIVEDEPKIADSVSAYLISKGFNVFTAQTGNEALNIFRKENLALIILDLMLPDISGESVCEQVRKQSRIPIIMLTAKVTEDDMFKGFSFGADDYIKKPFSLKELHARVLAVLRRTTQEPLVSKITLGDIIIDLAAMQATKNGVSLSLTPNEFRLLEVFVKYPDRTFTREKLIDIAFGENFDGFDRTIDSHIKNLRQKIGKEYIITVHGFGYKFGGGQ